MSKRLVLGFDISTQSCKCIAVELETLVIVANTKVHYDSDLPSYQTVDGIHRHPDGHQFTSPTVMWFDAMKLSLDRVAIELNDKGLSLREVVAISGSGQQHGTVYWSIADVINFNFDLQDQLSRFESPIWMDNSTKVECNLLEKYMGGAANMQQLTGSAAVERFSIHHITKFRKHNSISYSKTKRISLVSSFGASLLCGRIMPMDTTDAAGTNAMDIQALDWSTAILDFCEIDQSILGNLTKPWDTLGVVDNFWVKTHGLSPEAKVVSWSGDNPCAVVGMGLVQPGDILISLGTSDTCIFVVDQLPNHFHAECSFGHFFPHPLLANAFFGMLVYSNGDITRRKIRDEYAEESWTKFSSAIESTQGISSIGAYWTVDEISPPLAKRDPVRVEEGKVVEEFSNPMMNCRAVIEYKALIMKTHLDQMRGGTDIKRVLMTGGATSNPAIVQVFSDILGKPIVGLDMPEAAAYGACLRAVHAISTKEERMHLLSRISTGAVITNPNKDTVSHYQGLYQQIPTLLRDL